jgi:cytochrome c peroxidase
MRYRGSSNSTTRTSTGFPLPQRGSRSFGNLASILPCAWKSAAATRDRPMVWFLTIVLCVALTSPAHAQVPALQGPSPAEPITPIPSPPAQNPERVALGDRLFHDPRLSHNDIRSCASCHDTRTSGASPLAHDKTPDGKDIALNTPTIFNAALSFRLRWEGDVRSLETECEQTLLNPDIMATGVNEVLDKLRSDRGIVRQFRDAYGHGPDGAGLMDAIATYERSLLTPGGRFDLWLSGQTDAITQDELAGYQLFKSLGCISCHQGVNVGGNLYERHGIFHPLASPEPEVLRVPSLRNVATTPPYFHDGSVPTLPNAVRAMGYAQLDVTLSNQQTAAIVAFLNTLTGTYSGGPVTLATGESRTELPP